MFCSTVILRKIDSSCGQVTHAEPGALVHRVIGHVVAGENDPAAVWPDETDDHVKAGRLAGAVLAEQADDLALPNVQFDSVHDRAAAVDLDQVVRHQDFSVLVRMIGPRSRFGRGWRRSLANHRFFVFGVGDGDGFPFLSLLASCLISVRLGPCVVR